MGVLRLAISRSNCCPSRSSGLMMLALVLTRKGPPPSGRARGH